MANNYNAPTFQIGANAEFLVLSVEKRKSKNDKEYLYGLACQPGIGPDFTFKFFAGAELVSQIVLMQPLKGSFIIRNGGVSLEQILK